MPDQAPGDHRLPTLAETLAERPDLIARLLAEHRPDEARRCRSCTTPGYGTPGERWPCTVARLAQAAQRLTEGDDGEAHV